MYLSINWLKEYVDIPKSITPEELGLRLTMHTVEIDSIEKQGEFLEKVVVGEILEIKKHPNADKLSVAKIDVGEKEPRQIIFGQMVDMEVGFKIPVALAPAKLPGNIEIKKVTKHNPNRANDKRGNKEFFDKSDFLKFLPPNIVLTPALEKQQYCKNSK